VKRTILSLGVLFLAGVFSHVPPAWPEAAGPGVQKPYWFAGIGIFKPQDDIDRADTGLSLQGGVGAKVHEMFAVDATLGFHSGDGGGISSWTMPLTVGGRAYFPVGAFEPYAGAGFGLYLSGFDGQGINDTAVDFGYYLQAGGDAWLSRSMAVNFDLRRHWTSPSFNGREVDIGGWSFTIGAKFGF